MFMIIYLCTIQSTSYVIYTYNWCFVSTVIKCSVPIQRYSALNPITPRGLKNTFTLHCKKNISRSFTGMEQWYFPSRIVFSRCEEKLSKYNFAFFKGFEIPKMAAEVLFEVEAVHRDLGMVRGCHFSNRKTREKANYTRIIF